jgi:hypothetical protein
MCHGASGVAVLRIASLSAFTRVFDTLWRNPGGGLRNDGASRNGHGTLDRLPRPVCYLLTGKPGCKPIGRCAVVSGGFVMRASTSAFTAAISVGVDVQKPRRNSPTQNLQPGRRVRHSVVREARLTLVAGGHERVLRKKERFSVCDDSTTHLPIRERNRSGPDSRPIPCEALRNGSFAPGTGAFPARL